jgi:hypothetical protein
MSKNDLSQIGEPLLVPVALCGTSSAVKDRWASVVRRAIKTGTWGGAIKTDDMIPIDAAQGDIVLGGPYGVVFGDGVMAFHVVAGLAECCKVAATGTGGNLNRELWYEGMKALYEDGLGDFWFCLGILGAGSSWFPLATRYDTEAATVARETLSALVRWWPTFARLEPRFSLGVVAAWWPAWAHIVQGCAAELGISNERLQKLREVPSRDAGRVIEKWLAQSVSATD